VKKGAKKGLATIIEDEDGGQEIQSYMSSESEYTSDEGLDLPEIEDVNGSSKKFSSA
jgi:hypothetical protein